MRIVHLPYYSDNPYQTLLMEAQRKLGHEVYEGGGGGNFIRIASTRWHADILHFHWIHPYLLRTSIPGSVLRSVRFIFEVMFLRFQGARIFWTIHNLTNHAGCHVAIEAFFSSLFAKMTDACFVHSQAAATAAADRFHIPLKKLHVIPHGHYVNSYPNTIGKSDARKQLSLPIDARIFLFLGRIEPYKGVSELIDAFLQLPPNSHLLIAGKAENSGLLQEIKHRSAGHSNIHFFHKHIPNDELQVYYNAADVVIFPFRRILTSGSLVLAMSFGRAIIAPALPFLKEIIPEDGAIWFDPDGNPPLIDALEKALESDSSVAGLANLERVRTWDWIRIAEATLGAANISMAHEGEGRK